MKERIKFLLEDALPLVDFDTDFLFNELDSLGIASILMILSEEYKINLDGKDVTPRNFKSLDSLVSMVQNKLDNNK
ncbi:MAG: acyl carrier protein [Bacteroidaceae bacterium]|jgi:acyl carrier protein|nr:acyl carrier protein [Bacteroidaceae bacterium]